MKKTPNPTSALAGDRNAAADASTSTAPMSPTGAVTLSTETLLHLGALYADAEMAGLLGEYSELVEGRGIQAGLVAALHMILPPAQFRAVMIQWEVDAIKLSEFLHIAGASETKTIEA